MSNLIQYIVQDDPEEELKKILSYMKGLDVKAIANEVMQRLLVMFETKFDLTLTKPEETA